MTIGDGIILSVLALVVFLIVFFQIRGKKNGKSSCHCASCDKREFCEKINKK